MGCVCACLRAPLVPRHSWLGCWGVCGLLCALRLYPATPGWGVRCECVCLGSGFGCAPPLLAGVLGCVCFWARSTCTPPLLAGVRGVGVCAWARVSAAPRHSWLGCWGVRLLVCALRLHPATPGWGVRCGHVRLGSGFGCAPPLLAGVLGCVCLCVRTPLVPRDSWLGRAVWVCVLELGCQPRPATPGWGVRCWRVSLGSGFGCLPSVLAGVLGCACLCARSACTLPLLAGVCGVVVCVWARVSAAFRHSWLGCWGVSVFVCALRLYPATPSWVVRCGRVCFGSGLGCAPPLLAGVCGVGVCVWARVSAAPRHSWLGCWGVCVFVCALRLYPATPSWGMRCGHVCLGSGFGCAPPLLAGVLGCVCACVRAPLVPRHSWLGCAVWLCVSRLGFRLRPASPGWGVGVCVFVCALRLYPATPCWGARHGCVCLGSGFGCALPLLAGVLGCVSLCVRTPLVPRDSWLGRAVWVCVLGLGFRLRPANPGWGVRCGRVCLGSGFGCVLPFLAGVLGCACFCARSACTLPLLAGVCDVVVCVWARVSAAPRHSWLGCWGVCVFVCALRLYPATPSWGVRCGRVCLGSGLGCAPPLLAGVCGGGVTVWAPVLALSRHSWLGCWGLRVCVRSPLLPRHSWLGCAVWACVFGLGSRLHPANPRWGVGVCVCLCAGSTCTPPLVAGVCGVGVRV